MRHAELLHEVAPRTPVPPVPPVLEVAHLSTPWARPGLTFEIGDFPVPLSPFSYM